MNSSKVVYSPLDPSKINNILFFVPNTLETDKYGYLEGFATSTGDCLSIFITNDALLELRDDSIGFWGTNSLVLFSTPVSDQALFKLSGGKIRHGNVSLVQVTYDYEAFKNSDVIEADDDNYGCHIQTLTQKLSESRNKQKYSKKRNRFNISLDYFLIFVGVILKLFTQLKFITKYSAILIHIEDKLTTVHWLIQMLKTNKKFSPKIGNVLVATAIDISLGLLFARFCMIHQDFILKMFQNVSREFLSQLKHLLIYLMGSPIGLKLNHAFNHSLGTFFFYHINLSRVFLQTLQPVLKSYFGFLVLPAVFGLSFQVAMLSDIMSMMTFHIYSIYVYAAKLFSLQIRGLSSLWKLFMGRKFNPLRNRVDSCEYSPNQLFIGTLGFTILLFLLPTTTMYYVVFATFRLATILTNTVFNKIKNLLNILPLYIVILWMFNHSSIAGNLYINWEQKAPGIDHNIVRIEAKLSALSLPESLKKFATGPDKCVLTSSSLDSVAA